MFSFYDQLIIYLCKIRDRVRLILRLITKSRGLIRLDTVRYQQLFYFTRSGPITFPYYLFLLRSTPYVEHSFRKTLKSEVYLSHVKFFFFFFFI